MDALAGADQIVDGSGSGVTDRLVFETGLNAGDLSLTRSQADADDVTLTFAGKSGSIMLDEQFNYSGGYGLEKIQFGDGVVGTRAQILANAGIRGGVTADTINGASGSDQMDGHRQ